MNHTPKKLILLLCDDVYNDLDRIKANLMRTATPGTERLIAVAEEFFEIHEFCCVGVAIRKMEMEGLRPDFIITDLDFSSLHEQHCPDYLDYEIESSPNRGWDLRDFVVKHFNDAVPWLILTGQESQPEIFEALKKLRDGFLFKRADKGFLEILLARYMPSALQLIIKKKYFQSSQTEKRNLRKLFENQFSSEIKNAHISLAGKVYLFQQAFIGWGKISVDFSDEKLYSIDFHDLDKVIDELENFTMDSDRTDFRGAFSHEFVQNALNGINNNVEYAGLRKEIDHIALDILVTLLADQNIYGGRNNLLIGNYDLSKYFDEKPGIEITDFRECLKNAMILRLVLIGGQYLMEKDVWRKSLIPSVRRFATGYLVSELFQAIGLAKNLLTEAMFKKKVNTFLGLCGTYSVEKRDETIMLGPGKIHPSERRWLDIVDKQLLTNSGIYLKQPVLD